jgi:hypothetical protein
MSRLLTILVCSCVGFAIGACSGDDEDDDGGSSGSNLSCQVEDEMGEVIGCAEHEIPAAALDDSREACTAGGGTVVERCPSAGRIGSCSLVDGALVMNSYEAAGETAADAETRCEGSGGEWTGA